MLPKVTGERMPKTRTAITAALPLPLCAAALVSCVPKNAMVIDREAGLNGSFEIVDSGYPVNWAFFPQFRPGRLNGGRSLGGSGLQVRGLPRNRSKRTVARGKLPDGLPRTNGASGPPRELMGGLGRQGSRA
jgi:hypothetical protein